MTEEIGSTDGAIGKSSSAVGTSSEKISTQTTGMVCPIFNESAFKDKLREYLKTLRKALMLYYLAWLLCLATCGISAHAISARGLTLEVAFLIVVTVVCLTFAFFNCLAVVEHMDAHVGMSYDDL